MPIYEYECKKCGHHAEVLQKFSDPPISTCEKCKGRMRKLISHSTFHLKGSGWYVTDYASKKSDTKTSAGDKPEKSEKAEAKSPKTENKAKESSSKSPSTAKSDQ
jgi:putative FmdB family regulatory protein